MRAELPWAGAFLGAAGLVAAPLLVYFALHPAHFFLRSKHLWVFDPVRSQGNPLGTFLFNVWDHLLVLGFRGDPSWRNNYAGQPMLNPWEAFFFWLGVGMAVWRWQRRPAYRLLLLWLAVLILPAMLALDYSSPNTLRMIGAAPAIYLLVGVGMWEAFQFLKERCRALPWRTSLIFQENNTRAAIAVGAVVIGLILVQGVITYRTYFQKWAAAPEVNEVYKTMWIELARTLNAQPSDTDMVYLIPGDPCGGGVRFQIPVCGFSASPCNSKPYCSSEHDIPAEKYRIHAGGYGEPIHGEGSGGKNREFLD